MKKILVLSDSHRNVERMHWAVDWEQPDLIIHLGDCISDAEQLKATYTDFSFECVPGNCDCSMETAVRILEIEGKRVMICHGHTFRVKSGLLNLELGARERGVDIALFGHTHRVFYETHNGVTYLNPGSIGSPGYGVLPSYGVLQIDGEQNKIAYDIVYIEGNQRKILTN